MKVDASEINERAEFVADEDGGIQPAFEAFYLISIIYSASRCLDAFERYSKLSKKQENAEELVSSVQEAVGHAGALSRYFWPSPKAKKGIPHLKKLKDARGHKLRIVFEVNDSSPLYNRDLRNAWEHFDEKMDEYLLENFSGQFFPSSYLGSHQSADNVIKHVFKLLDVQEW